MYDKQRKKLADTHELQTSTDKSIYHLYLILTMTVPTI